MIRFFFNNKKRTYQSILTLSLGLVIYLATTMLITGYSSHISGMAATIQPSQYVLITEKGKSLSDSRLSLDMLIFLEEYAEEKPNIQLVFPQIYFPVVVRGETGIVKASHLRLLNFTLFEQVRNTEYEYDFTAPNEGEIIVGKLLFNQISTGVGGRLTLINDDLNLNGNLSVLNIVTTQVEHDIEILAPIDLFNLLSFDYYSLIELKVKDNREIPAIKSHISNHFSNVSIEDKKQTQNFIKYGTREVVETITLLQSLFFVLMLVSITYSIYTLVKESEREIFILRSIGATTRYIIALFVVQSLMIGIIAALISITIGYLLITAIVAIVAATTALPYISLSFGFDLIGTIFFFSLIVSTLSGIYPSFLAAKIKIVKEDLSWI